MALGIVDFIKACFCGGMPYMPPKGNRPRLPENDWTPVVSWQGLTLQTLTLRVTVRSAASEERGNDGQSARTLVEWRRWGGGLIPYSSGTFSDSTVFHIYPGDLFLRIDLRTVAPGLDVEVEQL